jgi:hypothetical protein
MAGGYWNLEAAKPRVLREFLFHRHGGQQRGEPTSADLSIIGRLSKRQLVAACYAGVRPLGVKDNGRLVWPTLPPETPETARLRWQTIIEAPSQFRWQQEEEQRNKDGAQAGAREPRAGNIHRGSYPPDHPVYNEGTVAITTFTHARRTL